MNLEWWLAYMEKAGSVAAVLEFGALWWLHRDRAAQIARHVAEKSGLQEQLEGKTKEVQDLAERVITIAAELKMFLFNERKT